MKTINAIVYVKPDKVNEFISIGKALTIDT